METVRSLRHLWRHRILVGLGFLVALLAGAFVTWNVSLSVPPKLDSKRQRVGVASAQMLVDTPSSQTVDVGGGAVATDVVAMISRARLLANIMATSPLKDEIARRAGIDPRSFTALSPSLGEDAPRSPAGPADAYVMSVYFNEALPIITAAVQGSDRATAARIAAAAADVLTRYVRQLAVLDRVPVAQRLVIKQLGPPHAEITPTGARAPFGAMAFLIVLGAWCIAIIIVTRLSNGAGRAAAVSPSSGPERVSA